MTRVWRVINVAASGTPIPNDAWKASDERFRVQIFTDKEGYPIICDTPDLCIRLMPMTRGDLVLQLFYVVDDGKP